MPPESLRDRLYSEKSDVWAFGVTLFEIATGLKPFGDDDLIKIVLDVRDQGRTVLTGLSADVENRIPSYILNSMQKCFLHDPSERPTFAELEKMLSKGAPSGFKETNADSDDDEKSGTEAPSAASSAPSNYHDGALSRKEKKRNKNKKNRTGDASDPWQQEERTESGLQPESPSEPAAEVIGYDSSALQSPEAPNPSRSKSLADDYDAFDTVSSV
jgi:hypothetical protein